MTVASRTGSACDPATPSGRKQNGASAHLVARADDSMPAASARVAAGHPVTAGLGAMFGMITVELMGGDRA